MVLRLTDEPIPDTDQLIRQADTITSLTLHRDLLLHQAEEQRLRWTAERNGWARMAEALVAQQSKHRATNPEREDDIERLNASLESDNKNLRQKLTETQSRLQLLEAELTRLRPLLFMQPLSSSTSIPPPCLTTTPQRPKHTQRKRRKDQLHSIPEDETMLDMSDDDTVTAAAPPLDAVTTPTTSLPSQSTPTPKSKSRKQDSTTNASRGLSADARVEHLLLAARKVGKDRATILSGMLQQLEEREREREQERRQEEFTAFAAAGITPKTPKRGSAASVGGGGVSTSTATGSAYPGYPLPTETGYVYISTPSFRPPTTQTHGSASGPDSVVGSSATATGTSSATGGAGLHTVPVFIPAYSHPIFQTPTSSAATLTASHGSSRAQNPQTPLDSLLSAARSMMRSGAAPTNTGGNAGDTDEPLQVAGSRRSALALHDDDMIIPDSPLPKRRKLASREDVGTLLTTSHTGNATTATAGTGASNATAGRVKRWALERRQRHGMGMNVSSSRKEKGNEGMDKGKEREQLRGDGSEVISEEHTGNESTGSEKGKEGTRRYNTRSRRPSSEVDGSSAIRSRTPGLVRGDTPGPRGSLTDGSVGAEGSTQNESGADVPGDPAGAEDVPTPKPLPPLGREEHGEVLSTTMDHSSSATPTPAPAPPTAPVALTPQTLSQTQIHTQPLPFSAPHAHIPFSSTATPSASTSSRESSPLDLYTRQRESQRSESETAPSVSGIAAGGGTPVSMLGGTVSGSSTNTEGDSTSTSAALTQSSGGASGQAKGGIYIQPTTIAWSQPARNKAVARVANQDRAATHSPAKRQRSPYMKWSKEEDELLTQAVAKYGQKWDLVQKALPSRGYHQVRQRWLRKLGVFDTKPDLSAFQTGTLTSPLTSSTAPGPGIANGSTTPSEPLPNPKLGLAPLSSELVFSSSSLAGRGGKVP
ncbi:hypothetical protein EDC04DRAFT_2662052 [Pisolithus marmoratus]|nr:hypothetical protein EDC04DRAFT_2662052 [Pisolithus marmoratus]